jgi:hypothetical protein
VVWDVGDVIQSRVKRSKNSAIVENVINSNKIVWGVGCKLWKS